MVERKQIRLPIGRYKGRIRIFLTLCTLERHPLFQNREIAKWLLGELRAIAEGHQFLLHAWCIMPDHVHLLAEGTHDGNDALCFVARLKQRTGYEGKNLWRRAIWQGRVYDHILRENESLPQVATYIWLNPVRKGLCADAREYPHSGSVTMDWKRRVPVLDEWHPPWKTGQHHEGDPLS